MMTRRRPSVGFMFGTAPGLGVGRKMGLKNGNLYDAWPVEKQVPCGNDKREKRAKS